MALKVLEIMQDIFGDIDQLVKVAELMKRLPLECDIDLAPLTVMGLVQRFVIWTLLMKKVHSSLISTCYASPTRWTCSFRGGSRVYEVTGDEGW